MPPLREMLLLGALIGCLLTGIAIGAWVQGLRKDAEISRLYAEQSEERASAAVSSLTDVQQIAADINGAATRYTTTESTLALKLAEIQKGLRNAKPLPVGCVPDAVRVRNLDAAIEAANAATTGQ